MLLKEGSGPLQRSGKRTMMLVPRPVAVRTSNWAPRFSARVRILESPKPSPPTNCGSAMPEPLSVTSMTRFDAFTPDADADNGRLRVANRVADGFLGNPEQLVPGGARQSLFGYIVRMKIASQAAGNIGTLDQLLQRLASPDPSVSDGWRLKDDRRASARPNWASSAARSR